MSLSADPSGQSSPGGSLPPVEPPSAGFIVQLFVIPAIIVAIIVLVWGLFNWLAQMGNDPASYVEALERNNEARWQSAMNLADELRSSQNDALKHNAAIAKKLADLLEAELKEGKKDDQSIQLRVYLCHALGEFLVPDGLEALIKVAQTGGTTEEKYASLKALAVFASANKNLSAADYDRMLPVVLEDSHESEPLLRSTAAFALGSLPGEKPAKRLEGMLVDADANVRFNAATSLARLGNPAAIEVLVEMLDPTSTAGLKSESEEDVATRDYKRGSILVNGLRAADTLAANNATADLSQLRMAASRLVSSADVTKSIQIQAKGLVSALEKRAASAPGKAAK